MKRREIIKILIGEGFTPKTLSLMYIESLSLKTEGLFLFRKDVTFKKK